jgi:cyclopropane-fatty-acyl-phospholipid synthase
LTLSRNQYEYALRRRRPELALEYRLEGWETYRDRCDRIVSFGAFEHFTVEKYPAFFARCRVAASLVRQLPRDFEVTHS